MAWNRAAGVTRTGDGRGEGKSDPTYATAAARATLAGTGTPKTRTGPVEAIRALRVARRGAVKARTAAVNQMRGLGRVLPIMEAK
ncbi:hypothetical protein ACFT9M_12905 [Micromonospora purpureochromogenes]|uniref:hypothetical protein n=1 Tax=Micromonospora purpureochromogenes TaxID=47872 RepID=UPI0036262DAD